MLTRREFVGWRLVRSPPRWRHAAARARDADRRRARRRHQLLLSQHPASSAGDYMDTLIDAFQQTGIAVRAGIGACRARAGDSRGGRVPAAITPEYTKRREELRQWRLTTPLARFEEIRGKFTSGRHRSLRLRRDVLGRLHGRGDRSLVSVRAGARCGRHRNEPDARADGAAARPVRGEIRRSRSAGTTTPT